MSSSPVVLPIELTPSQVRPVAYRIISKKHGLNLKSSALEVLASFLGRHFGAEWRGRRAERCLDDLSRQWKDEDRGLFVDGNPLRDLIKDWLNAQASTQHKETQEKSQAANSESKHQESSHPISRQLTSINVPPASTATAEDSLVAIDSAKNFQWRQYFSVVDAHTQRRLVYNPLNHHFELASPAQARSVAPAEALTRLFPARYHVLYDRLGRNDEFQTRALAAGGGSGADAGHAITPINNLAGREFGTEYFLFGQLTRIESDAMTAQDPLSGWVLSDTTNRIALEFTEHTDYAFDHYYPSGSYVLCHGVYAGEYFQVGTMGPPTVERRTATQQALGNVDFFGSINRIERVDPNLEKVLRREEASHDHHRIVFLGGDLYLDQHNSVDALRRVLEYLNSDPPIALVLSGSFVSVPFRPHSGIDGEGGSASYRDAMNTLAELLQSVPRLGITTKIVLIPGDNDPWHAAWSSKGTTGPAWPLQPIPSVFTGRVERSARDVVLTSNPTRVLWLTQELVIARDDYGLRMRRHSLNIPSTLPPQDEMSDMTLVPESEGAMTLDSGGSEGEANAAKATIESDDDDFDEKETNRRAYAAMRAENHKEQPNIHHQDIVTDTLEARKVVATILDQCHLSPFKLSARPVSWEHDSVLSMAQWPSSLVIVDSSTPQFKQVYEDCHVMNPGTFLQGGKAQWLEFWPASGRCDFNSL